jgi:hypothetical protein
MFFDLLFFIRAEYVITHFLNQDTKEGAKLGSVFLLS